MPVLSVPKGGVPVERFGPWTLYDMPEAGTEPSPLWLRFKLMLPPETPRKMGRKASFYLHWNPDELRLRRDGFAHALQAQEPELFVQVEMWFTLNRDLDYLRREFGLTDEEIELERRRLASLAEDRMYQRQEYHKKNR